jgi:hypothetical protein
MDSTLMSGLITTTKKHEATSLISCFLTLFSVFHQEKTEHEDSARLGPLDLGLPNLQNSKK